MTVPPGPDDADSPYPAEPPRPRHAAPSPSGMYLPPQQEADEVPAMTRMPRFTPHGAPSNSAPSHGAPSNSAPSLMPPAPGTPPPAPSAPPHVTSAPPPVTGVPLGEVGSPVAYQGPRLRPASRHSSGRPSPLRLIWIYPDLLSTYGDRGNLIMLTRRASLRGIEVESISVQSDQPVPRQGDIYLLGGGEDLPQVLAAQRLRSDGGLAAAAADGAVVFAVCAGYQLLGSVFGGAQGEPVDGLGILDISSGRGAKRGVGEVVAEVDPALGVDRLTGFENHQGVTRPGPGARPLARTLAGVGNGDGTEGAYAGRVLGTYLHGPALVRNPGLADLLLTWATGIALVPLADEQEAWTQKLRSERLAAVPA